MGRDDVFKFVEALLNSTHYAGGQYGHKSDLDPKDCPHDFCKRWKEVKVELDDIYDKCWMYDELCE